MPEVVTRVPSEDHAGREEAGSMLDESQLSLMSPEQRACLARTLAALDRPRLADRKVRLRRRVALTIVLACCAFLVAWICVLALTLPSHYTAGGWRGAWVGFDIVELFGFAAVAWFAWRGKQLLVVALIVTATLLFCDAWFDLTLDWGTPDFSFSLFSAICGELPLVLLMILGARRLLRLTVATTMAAQGNLGPVPPLWKVPLMGTGPGEPHGPRLRSVRDASGSPDGQVSGGRPAPGQPPGPDPAGDWEQASYPG